MFDRIDAWVTWLSWKNSAATVKAYRYEAVRLFLFCDGELVDRDRLFAHLIALPASVRYRAACALRSFFIFAERNDLAKLIALPKRDGRKPGRTLQPDQLLAVLTCCDTSTVVGRRDLALQALMVDSGLRAAEICRLQIEQVDLGNRLLWVVVKGGQTGFGSFGAETANYLSAWLSVRSSATPFVFTAVYHDRGLTSDGLRSIFHKIGLAAGLPHYSPHDLRRTFATIASLLGCPPRVLQVAGRWERLSMVERYTAAIRAQQIAPYLPVSGIMSGRIGGPGLPLGS